MVAIEEGGPEDIPRVVLDDYQAMRGAIVHLVEAHGYRRIAFIRGPDATHRGANARYQAYQDVLAENGLFDPDLVSPPTAGVWSPETGKAAISLFLDQRGVNFEAVVGVNDGIAIAAMQALQARGIHIPQQVAVVGFDDVDESNSVIPSLTTVSIQSYDLGRQAVEILFTLLEGGEVPQKVATPLKNLIIRQSCGCTSASVNQAAVGPVAVPLEPFERAVTVQQDNILAAMRQAIEPSATELQFDWADQLLTAFLTDLEGEPAGGFGAVLETMLQQTIVRGGRVGAWPNVVSALRRSVLPYLSDSRVVQRAEDLWLQAQVLIGETAQQAQRYQAAQAEQQSQVLEEIGSILTTTFDLEDLMNILAQELPRLGIPSCYLSVYEDPQRPAEQAELLLAYDERGRLKPEKDQQVFPSSYLTPEELLPQGRRYSMVVQALYFREEQLGLVLFEAGPRRGMIYETLRERISSALKGALLVQQEEKRVRQSQTVAEVSTIISTILDTDELLQRVVDLTKASFELYHAHIYLLNEAGDTLNLMAGAGEVGRQMVAQGWNIPLKKKQSLVARAARTQRGVIENDVRKAPDWLPNPLLPETRSELAAPMIVGDRVLGVLDVQSDKVSHFTEEDMRIQTTLAAQVAVALQNARSFAEQQQTGFLLSKRVRELDCLNEIGRAVIEAPPLAELLQWVTERVPAAMQYPELCRVAIQYEGQLYGASEAIKLPTHMTNALRIGQEVVGRMYVAYREKRDFLDEESAMLGGIASRVSAYIESQRLIGQIQQRATELEDAQTFLNSIIENMPTALFVKEANELRFVRWNKASEALFGFSKAGIVGKNDYDFFPKEEADFFTAKDREVLAGGQLVDIPEEPIHNAQQELRFLHTTKVPILGADGQPKYLLGLSEDITERKATEEALHENEARLSETMKIAGMANWEFDVATQTFTFNDQFYSLFRTTAEQEGGYLMPAMQYAQKFVHPEDAYLVGAEIEQALKTTDPNFSSQIEHRIIRADGSEGYILVRYRVVKDEQGRTVKTIGANQDITERKQAEEALKQEQEWTQTILESITVPMIISRVPDGVILYANDPHSRFFSIPREKLIGQPTRNFFEEPAERDKYVALLRSQGAVDDYEVRIRKSNDELRWVLVSSRLFNFRGQAATLTILIDITERKQVEAERERLLAEVEATYRQFVQREWEQFLSGQPQGGWRIEHRQPIESLISDEELTEAQAEVVRDGKPKVVVGHNGQPAQPAIVAPITLRGQVIGTFSLQDIDPNRHWTDEEKALLETVSEQLALTIENLRLFDDTQKRATREQLTRQITDRMRAAPDVDSIIQTGLAELAKALNVSRAYVKLTTQPEAEPSQPTSNERNQGEQNGEQAN
jgi:PAS domain S-box-containing protein